MLGIQVLQRIPRLCIRCVKCDEVGNICNLIGPWVLNQYDGTRQLIAKEKIINFSSYCIPLKLATVSEIVSRSSAFLGDFRMWVVLYSLITRDMEDSLTPVQYAYNGLHLPSASLMLKVTPMYAKCWNNFSTRYG
jgi:hypothetical protein